jgi:4-hydroxy-tetrahydrodipicolinate reductase
MGRAIDELAAGRGHRRIAVYDGPLQGDEGVAELLDGVSVLPEVAFEFTQGDVAEANVIALLRRGVHVIGGTTGWTESPALDLALAGSGAALVLAPNFSVGMNLFFRAVRHVAGLLAGAGLYQPYVLEAHHRGKRDVPSGTARRLAEILQGADARLQRVQEGNPQGPLDERTLQVCSVRAGAEPGMHEVGFDGEYDVITLRHASRSRDGFALGAVLAAEWVRDRQGRHSFDDVLETLNRG